MNGRDFFKKYDRLIEASFVTYKHLPYLFKTTINKLAFKKDFKLLLRYFDLKNGAEKIGKNIFIGDYVRLKNIQYLSIGDNFSVHEFSYLDCIGGVKIGNNVSIAHNCSLVSFDHTWNEQDLPIKYNSTICQEIIIGDDVWIGCGVRILSGSVIEDRVIVAAGAVVKGNLETGYLYGGIPARKLKKL